MPFKAVKSIEISKFLLHSLAYFCLPVNDYQRSAAVNQARLEEEKMTVTQFSDDCWWNWFESFLLRLLIGLVVN
jgi:hypothetical protein